MLPFGFSRVLALLALLFVGCGHKPPAARPAHVNAQAEQPTLPKGLYLYALERDGRTSYLLGTIHLGFGFEEILTPSARQAFEGSQVVITETDVGSDAPEHLMRAALLPPEQSLDKLIDPPTWNALNERVGEQMPPMVLTRLKPWLPAVLIGLMDLTEALKELRPGGDQHAMDLELITLARKQDKAVRYLESMDEQIAVFESVPIEEQVSELKRALTDDGAAQSRALVHAFASGDEKQLAQAVFDDSQLSRAPGFYKAVLFDRNDRWIPMIERAMSEQPTFVAVGVAHLLGSRGLISQLKQRGYGVRRVM